MIQSAEATIHIAGGDLFAHSESDDMYAAIDALSDKLDRQLIKHKQKHRGH
jgi:putative sigma-54 modulation protein